MTLHIPKQTPISLLKAHKKTDLRVQFGALVYRVQNDRTQVLLITTRRTQSWTIPKGWPMSGKTPAEAAAQEAWEEAGVKGTVHNQTVGFFSYFKNLDNGDTRENTLPVMVSVYPVAARKLTTDFPEAGQRRRKWLSPKKAAAKVREKDLARILKNFDARQLR